MKAKVTQNVQHVHYWDDVVVELKWTVKSVLLILVYKLTALPRGKQGKEPTANVVMNQGQWTY